MEVWYTGLIKLSHHPPPCFFLSLTQSDISSLSLASLPQRDFWLPTDVYTHTHTHTHHTSHILTHACIRSLSLSRFPQQLFIASKHNLLTYPSLDYCAFQSFVFTPSCTPSLCLSCSHTLVFLSDYTTLAGSIHCALLFLLRSLYWWPGLLSKSNICSGNSCTADVGFLHDKDHAVNICYWTYFLRGFLWMTRKE